MHTPVIGTTRIPTVPVTIRARVCVQQMAGARFVGNKQHRTKE